ncbi:MAG: Response regulator receiver protein [Clostridia bacterium 41_269]|nr:MAG: Response regulator receiver protein [Clostridia bacterium 41_269]
MRSSISILVVDDQEGIRQLLSELLTAEGFDVRLASNGMEALNSVEEKCDPNIIIIDMKMPGISGLDVVKELKGRGYKGIFILMTAYGELEIVDEAIKLGVEYHINKPFDIDDLLQLIRNVCRNSFDGTGSFNV